MLLLPPGVAPTSVTQLALDVSDAPGVLLRVLGICQRRGAHVLAMTYAHPRLELAVSADERHLQLLRGRLENAIDVLAVSYSP
jgi:acetolactate synthase regulatory subunit